MKHKGIRIVTTVFCELVTVGAIVASAMRGSDMMGLLLAVLTLALALLPWGIEKVFHCTMSSGLYVFSSLYAIGPMLGRTCRLYARLPVWDKLLHTSAGVVFAIVGIYLFKWLVGKDNRKILATAAFALCFSVTISAAWEIYEYSTDQLLGLNSQGNSYVSSIVVNNGKGGLTTIEGINSVAINGEEMNWKGYLDIGLNDTMGDMSVQSLGALAVAAFYLLDRERHPLVRRKAQTDT